jgi:hypothetical protein
MVQQNSPAHPAHSCAVAVGAVQAGASCAASCSPSGRDQHRLCSLQVASSRCGDAEFTHPPALRPCSVGGCMQLRCCTTGFRALPQLLTSLNQARAVPVWQETTWKVEGDPGMLRTNSRCVVHICARSGLQCSAVLLYCSLEHGAVSWHHFQPCTLAHV